ncbi:thiol:disulfide interchange protein DsbA/DsbL [Kitasatospora viridis]|uniref:Thiol:disulfide interchange protein DsbA n=1 Tax=Kitasatospora viridis TaxID=281105 RepID=A0A561UP44_9ACTN|nr:thiol:disulfide interchange protein DsbA/DsbL [Kitasatospora viridis]TWG01122.1 thiol:disulfide interchange protein DsbA [Kitasatospora viridis]
MTTAARAAALLLALTGGLVATPAQADGASYVPLAHPQAVHQQGTREVVEFFWYGCRHSQLLEQPLEDWMARQPKDVVLRRIPAVWPGTSDQTSERGHARLFYALDKLGEVDRLQRAVFEAVRDQGLDLTTESGADQWVEGQGVDGAKFRAAYESPQVQQEVDRAPQEMTRYEVNELPTAVVQGSWKATPTTAGGAERIPGVLDQLMAKAQGLPSK